MQNKNMQDFGKFVDVVNKVASGLQKLVVYLFKMSLIVLGKYLSLVVQLLISYMVCLKFVPLHLV